MKLWSDVEVTYLGSIDQHRLALFSYRDGDTASCVPQWFQIDDDEVLQCLDDAMSETSREGMAAWMTSNEAERVKDARLPLCLCAIEEFDNSWAVTRFLSPFVGEYVQTSILAGLKVKRRSLAGLLKNPYCFGIVGKIFEDWVFNALGLERRTLAVANER